MPAALLLAVALGQQPFGEPAQEVLRAAPEAEFVGGAWHLLGPIPTRERGTRDSLISRKALSTLRAGEPWPVLDEPFEAPNGQRMLWRDLELEAIADADAAEFLHPRLREGFETGRIELRRIPVLDADDGPRSAIFYRSIHARERATWIVELRHAGSMRLWLNGELALERASGEERAPQLVELAFAKGLNHLLIESGAPPTSSWSFELRHRHALTEPTINRSIDAGVRFLLSRQHADGSWGEFPYYPSGTTALALLALLKSDLPRAHAAARRALIALQRDPPRQTYSVALALLAVNAFGDPAHDAWIEEMAGDLVEWQNGNGLWGYPEGVGDLSNTQFAALALHAAAQRGVEIPKGTWRELAQATLSCRSNGGSATSGRARAQGFGYAFAGDAYASMTAAGVGTLQICAIHLGEDLSRRAEAAMDAGVSWLGQNCPLHASLSEHSSWTTYMLYGLERAGALMRLERFATHPWYAEGAAWLLEQQRGNGAWSFGEGSDVDTSFALLFLTRATAKAAVTQPGGDDGAGRLFVSSTADGPLILRAALGSALDLWVDAQSSDFTRMARVVYWLRPPDGEWQSLSGGASKRFDARAALDRSGIWQVRASAFLHDGSSRGSGTLEIPHAVLHATADSLQGLGPDPAANLLRGSSCEAITSSSSIGTRTDSLCDQASESRWLCGAEDAAPWLELRLQRRVLGRTLLLRPAIWVPTDPDQQPQPARIRVTLNDEEVQVIELADATSALWTVDFGRAIEVRRIRVEILEVRRGGLGTSSVGFGEVEVHERGLGQE